MGVLRIACAPVASDATHTRMARPPAHLDHVGSLRSALASPYPALRDAARAIVSRALLQPTYKAAAAELGISERAFERLRADFPELLEGASKKATRAPRKKA